MSLLIVASLQPRVGRSVIAAALAYRFAREGKTATLVRIAGDESAAADAHSFGALQYINAGAHAVNADDLASVALSADVVVAEAPAGHVPDLRKLKARIVEVAMPGSPSLKVRQATFAGAIITSVPARDVDAVRAREGVIGVLAEDRTLASPSTRDIAAALKARWLVEGDREHAIGRVMIGTVASDAVSPYFGARERKCVITRYDKTDIQLAALLTDMELLLLTGGGDPSPYLLDRVAGTRDDVSVLLAGADTVDTMRTIEGLYCGSRFEGQGKLERAVALLDETGVNIDLA